MGGFPARAAARRSHFSAAVDTAGIALTPKGRAFWVTCGDSASGLSLAEMVRWPQMERDHPDVMALPVRVAVPAPGAGWARSAARARFQHLPPPGRFLAGSEILLNPVTSGYESPAALLRALAHEATHMVQAKLGLWYEDSLHGTAGYETSPIEIEARAVAASVHPCV